MRHQLLLPIHRVLEDLSSHGLPQLLLLLNDLPSGVARPLQRLVESIAEGRQHLATELRIKSCAHFRHPFCGTSHSATGWRIG